MTIPARFLLHQGPAMSGLARVAMTAATAPVRERLGGPCRTRPSRRFEEVFPPPSPDLVRSYLEYLGTNPGRYEGRLPPHLFPQWSFGLLTKTLKHLTLPLHEMVNGGCRMEVEGKLPEGESLRVGAELVDVDESPSRWRFHHRIETTPVGRDEGVVAHVFNVLVRRSSGREGDESSGDEQEGAGDERPAPSPDDEELERWRLGSNAGFDFAKLTGDLNPIHWIEAAAKAAGFESTILHGFSTMAHAYEGLARAHPEVEDLDELDVRFTRPLVLPAEVGLYVDREGEGAGRVYVADALGETAYLVGDYRSA